MLVLAGDICTVNDPIDNEKFIALIDYYTRKYKYVFHVAGNHEYYTTSKKVTKDDTFDSVNKKLKAFQKIYPNYIYLNCDTATIEINKKKFMFIGASLWTKVNPNDYNLIEEYMNDYNFIYSTETSKFRVTDMQKVHKKHLAFIKKSVSVASEQKIPVVLITHHKPIDDSIPAPHDVFTRSREEIMNQAYSVDITDVIKTPVKLAIHGHCHKHYNRVIAGVRYVSNPIGYKGQHCGFIDDLIITL